MENKNEKVGPGKFVAFTYRLTNADNGELLFEAKADAPDTMVYGVTQEILPGLTSTMEGLGAQDKFSVTLPPEVAFGERLDDNVITLPTSTFERDGKMAEEVKVGAILPMLTEDGYTVTGKVIEMTPETVTMDFNHPFAGLNVQFDGEVVEVRDATEEEKQPKHGCCGGHCGCHSNEEGCGCGDDCGCTEEKGSCGCGDDCGCTEDKKDDNCGCGDNCQCK